MGEPVARRTFGEAKAGNAVGAKKRTGKKSLGLAHLVPLLRRHAVARGVNFSRLTVRDKRAALYPCRERQAEGRHQRKQYQRNEKKISGESVVSA